MMLEPNNRFLLTQAFRAPAGYHFHSGIATTYSLDLTTLLGATVHLSMFGDDSTGEEYRNGIALLEALRRTSGRLTVYCQTGQIVVPRMAHVLYGLLEPMVVPVTAPLGGVFHPKLIILRFEPAISGQPVVFRTLVMSRNLTYDRSWDVVLAMEGSPTGRNRRENESLRDLVAALPGMAAVSVPPARQQQAESIAEEVHTVEWMLPDGFETLWFETLGLRPRRWRFPQSQRLAVISPFVSEEGLRALSDSTNDAVALISRPEELDKLAGSTRQRFQQNLVLREALESEDGEDTPDGTSVLRGLHAKVYIATNGWDTSIFLGSANATKAAIVDCINVELLAGLTGKKSKVKGIDELLSAQGLGNALEPYTPGDPPAEEAEIVVARERLEEARGLLSKAALRLSCRGQKDAWQLTLIPPGPVSLRGISSARAWPISLRPEHSVDAMPLEHGCPVALPTCSLAAVTGFVAFELASEPAAERCCFVLNLPVDGLPEERRAAVVRTIVANREGFLKYLLFLLADFEEDGLPNELLLAVSGDEASRGYRLQDAFPLLEEMTRALSRDPARLRSIKSLIDDLNRSGDGDNLVPPEFMDLWRVYEAVLQEVER
ncbi:MAG: phospholipase D family protein [Acidobacteriota bacterium]